MEQTRCRRLPLASRLKLRVEWVRVAVAPSDTVGGLVARLRREHGFEGGYLKDKRGERLDEAAPLASAGDELRFRPRGQGGMPPTGSGRG